MSTNEKANLKLDKNNDEAVVELSPTEADAVAGGVGASPPPVILNPQFDGGQSPPPPAAAGDLHTPEP